MEIKIYQGNSKFSIDNDSFVVIIDVLRAGTTAQYILSKEVVKYYFAKDEKDAFEKKNKDAEIILVGEHKGIKINGFDLGNSPFEIMNADLAGKKVVHLTTNGVKAINNNWNKNTFFCGFCNANALVIKLKEMGAKKLAIIASDPISEDDLACAEYIKNKLLGKEVKEEEIIKRIIGSYAAEKFQSEDERFPIVDLELACEIVETNFAIKIDKYADILFAFKSLINS